MKKGIIKKCEKCDKDIYVRPYQINDKSRRFCSLKCKGAGRDINGKNNPRWAGGLPHCLDCGKELSQVGYKYCLKHHLVGDRHSIWKGDKVGYEGLHQWVKLKRGKPTKCEHCGRKGYCEWANKSHEYKRELDDWLSLCKRCHIKYDRLNGWGNATKRFKRKLYFRSDSRSLNELLNELKSYINYNKGEYINIIYGDAWEVQIHSGNKMIVGIDRFNFRKAVQQAVNKRENEKPKV